MSLNIELRSYSDSYRGNVYILLHVSSNDLNETTIRKIIDNVSEQYIYLSETKLNNIIAISINNIELYNSEISSMSINQFYKTLKHLLIQYESHA